jgi:hypothetical protein
MKAKTIRNVNDTGEMNWGSPVFVRCLRHPSYPKRGKHVVKGWFRGNFPLLTSVNVVVRSVDDSSSFLYCEYTEKNGSLRANMVRFAPKYLNGVHEKLFDKYFGGHN